MMGVITFQSPQTSNWAEVSLPTFAEIIDLLLGFVHTSVSPAYGYIALALVKCSNEGGPGPRYNMKEDPGSSIFSMLVVYGCYLYLLPFFSEPGDWKDQCGPLPPSFKPTWAKPPPPPWGTYSTPCKDEGEASLGGNHTSASDSRSEAADWARGWCGDHPQLFGASVRGQAAELEASAGWPARAFIVLLCVISGKSGRAGTTKTHHGGPVRGMSLYKGSQCTFLPLSSNI